MWGLGVGAEDAKVASSRSEQVELPKEWERLGSLFLRIALSSGKRAGNQGNIP